MGMLRVRLIGSKQTDPQVIPRYAFLVERTRDHAFLDFTGWTTVAGVPTPPSGWAAPFSPTPAQPGLELAPFKQAVAVARFLDQIWWADIDVSKAEDADYYLYYYNLTADVMDSVGSMPIVAGDDSSLLVRLTKGTVNCSFAARMSAQQLTTSGVTSSGLINVSLGLPKP